MPALVHRGYFSPILKGFSRGEFENASRRAAPLVAAALRADRTYSYHGPWMIRRGRTRSYRQLAWLPKIYICVRSSGYWPTIVTLMELSARVDMVWKFFRGENGYQRPDKVVVYCRSGTEMRQIIRLLRGSLGRFPVHGLRHAASTSQLGLEATAERGLFVGADPRFIGQSWRLYRCVCIEWLRMNRGLIERLPGGVEQWMDVMNLSNRHEGPAAFRQSAARMEQVKKYWSMMIGAEYGSPRG